MKCKGAIFDMDGLLFDTERIYQETWQEIAAELGVTLGSCFTRDVSGTSGAHMQRIIEAYYSVSDGSVIIENCMRRVREKLSVHVPVKKGVREILDFFREKEMRMAVASSSTPDQIAANLKLADLYGYFMAVVSGTEVRAGKPAPDIFLYAAERIGCEPDECIVFEDSENGIRAGRAAGCITIMVPDLLAASPEIQPYCTRICMDLSEAKEKIQEML